MRRKKLIEVAIPLDAVNRGCEEDKNRKTGHVRNLHKWFAPMPLPSWRAMLFASFVDDPTEHLGPDEAEIERKRLVGIMERLSSFDSYKDERLLSEAKAEIAKSVGTAGVTVVDPFCGGGSTVLEAQRLGVATNASDLNPIPVLITTALCRVPALFGNRSAISRPTNQRLLSPKSRVEGIKDDVRFYAAKVRERAWAELQQYYPPVEGGGVPFAYRWAWTVASPDPSAQQKHTPLVSNWLLSRHKTLHAWVEPSVRNGEVHFEIRMKGDVRPSSAGRSNAVCLHSNVPIAAEYIRMQGRSGKLGQVMFAIGARNADGTTYYVAPDAKQLSATADAPRTDMPGIEMPDAALGFRVQQYGLKNFLDLFTRRQGAALETFARLVSEVHQEILTDAVNSGFPDDGVPLEENGTGARAYADAVTAVLGLCIGKMAQSNNILVRWFVDPRNGSGKATPAFDRHAVPMVWDFVETNPFGGSVGDWSGPVLETALKAFDLVAGDGIPAEVLQRDARTIADTLPANAMIATDPPYYANIGYADLSDFFYVWLRESLKSSFPTLFRTVASPKNDELIASPFRHAGDTEKANQYFRNGFGDVFGRLSEKVDERFPILIVYAIKQSEESNELVGSTGWEVFLGGLVDAGLSVVATWPVRTTTDTRMIGLGNNALASAIMVVCRPRAHNAPVVSRREFISTLKENLPEAIRHLQRQNIAPVDLAQAAIGPGMAIYTRHSNVVDADGKPLRVRDALLLINETLDEVLSEQEGDFDAESRFAIAWFDQMGFDEGEFGIADVLARAKNTAVSVLVDAGIAESRAGKVRLLTPDELTLESGHRAHKTVWGDTHHVIRAHTTGGEPAAAKLIATLGSGADVVRELAYRLYAVAERKKRPSDALSYNALVQSWPEIARLSRNGGAEFNQGDLFGGE